MLFKIGNLVFNLAEVKTATKVESDIETSTGTKYCFFTIKLDNGDEVHCCKDSPTYEEFLEAWSEIIPFFKPRHNVSYKLSSVKDVIENMRKVNEQ